MDRKPLPPPFAKGTRVRYTGTRRSWIESRSGVRVPIEAPGLMVTIVDVDCGSRGTLQEVFGPWMDDDDSEPNLDTTRDGTSIYEVELPGDVPYRRTIWPKDAGEWERI